MYQLLNSSKNFFYVFVALKNKKKQLKIVSYCNTYKLNDDE